MQTHMGFSDFRPEPRAWPLNPERRWVHGVRGDVRHRGRSPARPHAPLKAARGSLTALHTQLSSQATRRSSGFGCECAFRTEDRSAAGSRPAPMLALNWPCRHLQVWAPVGRSTSQDARHLKPPRTHAQTRPRPGTRTGKCTLHRRVCKRVSVQRAGQPQALVPATHTRAAHAGGTDGPRVRSPK